MAWQFSEASDQIIGEGWGGTDFTIIIWWFIDTDPNNFQNPILIYTNSGGGGAVRGGIGTGADGTTMTTFDSAFATQAGGAPGVGTWYCTALTADDTTWNTYHGTNPASLTAVGPNTRNTITAPGSIVLSLSAEWWRGRLACLKIYNRTLSAVEVADEAAHYAAISSTNLVRRHTMLSTSMTADSGSGTALTAGSTAIALVDGPPVLVEPVTVAGTAPAAVGTLTGGAVITGAVAGTAPAAVGTLTGGAVIAGAVSGTAPAAVGTLTATETRTGVLAGTVTIPSGQLTGLVGMAGLLAGTAPAAVGTLTATETRTGVLAGTAPAARGALRQAPPIVGQARIGTVTLTAGARPGAVTLTPGPRPGTVVLT